MLYESFACRDIVDAGKLLAGMGIGEVYHVSTCEFLVFTPNCRETAGKVFERFKEFGREGLWYAVAAEPFISSEQDINRYLRRMKQGIAAAEVNECRFAIY